MKRLITITIVLIAIVLLLRGSAAYSSAIAAGGQWFRKIYGALVKGEK